MRYVTDSRVSNVDVLKHFQERSKGISVSKKDSVEQAPVTNVGKLGYDFMNSIPKADLLRTRAYKILDKPLAVNLSRKGNYYKEYQKNNGQPYSMKN